MSGDISGNLGGPANLYYPFPYNLRPLCSYSSSCSSPSSPLSTNRLPVCSLLHSSSPPSFTSLPVASSIRFRSPFPVCISRGGHRSRSRGRGRGTTNSHDRIPSPCH